MRHKIFKVLDAKGRELASSYHVYEAEYWLKVLPEAKMIKEITVGGTDEQAE